MTMMNKNYKGFHVDYCNTITDSKISHNWVWASDKICANCRYWDGNGFCTKNDTRTGRNSYCSYFTLA